MFERPTPKTYAPPSTKQQQPPQVVRPPISLKEQTPPIQALAPPRKKPPKDPRLSTLSESQIMEKLREQKYHI